MYSLHFLKSHRKIIFDITCRICIMRQLDMIMKPVFLRTNAQPFMPSHALILPVFIPFFLCTGPNKKLHLHLLKLTHAENELPCNDLIAECFSYLRDTKRNFHSS